MASARPQGVSHANIGVPKEAKSGCEEARACWAGRGVAYSQAPLLWALWALVRQQLLEQGSEALVEIRRFPAVFLSILESPTLDRYWHRRVLHEGVMRAGHRQAPSGVASALTDPWLQPRPTAEGATPLVLCLPLRQPTVRPHQVSGNRPSLQSPEMPGHPFPRIILHKAIPQPQEAQAACLCPPLLSVLFPSSTSKRG